MRNAEAALKKAGYQIVYSLSKSSEPWVLGRKGAQWLSVETYMANENPRYVAVSVLEKAMEVEMTATAEAWARARRLDRARVLGPLFCAPPQDTNGDRKCRTLRAG